MNGAFNLDRQTDCMIGGQLILRVISVISPVDHRAVPYIYDTLSS
jgi:hypothetical protein